MSIKSGWRRRLAALVAASVVVAVQMPTTSPVSAAVATQLRRYPYLTDVVAQYATINWATTTALTTGSATYGIAGSESCTAHAVTATRTTISGVGSVSLNQWEANLTLAPNTRYCYRVFGAPSTGTAVDLLGTDPSPEFLTQIPAGATQPYTFAVFGDWGEVDSAGANPWQANLMARLAASGARFALTTGDNGYPDGSQSNYGDLVQVGSNRSAVFGPQFWAVPGRSMPLFPSIGNHGFSRSDSTHPHFANWPQDRAVSTSGGRYQRDTYCCANGSTSVSVPSAWYAFDAGIARFYVLQAAWSNGNVGTATPYKMDADYHWTPGTAEYEWLMADLASHPSALKFAILHYPIHSDQASETSDVWLQGPGRLEGLLANNGVDIAFSGHAHIYQRNRAVVPDGLVTYLTGGGGADTQTIGPCTALDQYGRGWSDSSNTGNKCGTGPVPTVRDQVFHYLLVSVNGTSVTVTPTDSLGNTFDVMTYNFTTTTDTEPPGVPANLRTTSVATNEIGLAWDAASDNVGVTRYELTRDGLPLTSVNAPTTTYLDQGLTPGTTYRYAVRALDGAGNPSAYSPDLVVATSQAPTLETLTFLAGHDATVQAAIPGTNYGNLATLEADGSPDKDFLVRFDVSGIGARQVESATLYLRGTDPSSSGGTFSPTTTPTWDESTVTWSTAPPAGPQPVGSIGAVVSGTTYTLNVTSIVSGDGPLSLRASSASTNGVDYASSEAGPTVAPRLEVVVSTPPVTDPNPPDAPANLRATEVTANHVALAWDTALDDVGVTKYELTRDGAALATVNAPATTYTDAAVIPGTSYTYAVRALDAAGNQSLFSSDLVVAVPLPDPDTQPPATPTGLTATAASSTRVDLGWVAPTDNVGVTGYEIERNAALLTSVGAVTTYADTTVTAGLTYTYRVRARDAANNWSGWSSPASATTPTTPPPPSTMSIEASEDAYIRPDQAGANFGALTTLMVDASSEKDFLLKFVVGGTGGRTITSARLRLRALDGSPVGGEFYDVGDSWSEATVNWTTAPALGTLRVGTLGAVAANTSYEIDVTSYITGDGTYSLRVTSPNSDGADYVSSEGASGLRPVLTLTLTGP